MTGRENRKLPFIGFLRLYGIFYTQYIQHVYGKLRYGKMKSDMCVDFTEASQFWISLLKCMPNVKKCGLGKLHPQKHAKIEKTVV